MFEYLKVYPRGFAEVVYLRVPVGLTYVAEREFDGFEDAGGGHAEWTTERRARQPGVALEWADRARAGLYSEIGE